MLVLDIDNRLQTFRTEQPDLLVAINTMQKVVDTMTNLNLEADALDIGMAQVRLEWLRTVEEERSRSAIIYSTNYGLTFAHSRYDAEVEKEWIIKGDLSDASGLFLYMTMSESLEYIRHFIWADRN